VIRRGQYTTWVRTAQRGLGPEGVTLTFFQGHVTKLGRWGATSDLKTCQVNGHNLVSKVIQAPSVNC